MHFTIICFLSNIFFILNNVGIIWLKTLKQIYFQNRTLCSDVKSRKIRVWELGKLNHVAIAVPNLEKASNFYKDVLGATVSEKVVSTIKKILPKKIVWHSLTKQFFFLNPLLLKSLKRNMVSTQFLSNWEILKLR